MSALFEGLPIGGYQLIRLLGEGGMGEVWLGQDRLADRKVALKFIKPHLLSDSGFRARFINEAKTLGKLEHDRIVTLYSVLEEGDHLALILRFIDGISLAGKIDTQGALPLDFVLSCAGDILPALGFAHKNGVIHRDIKPPNILIDSEGRSFLMDFGIAVAAFAERHTMTGLAIGTPHYMSPEQIRTPQAIRPETNGHSTDIYSFGIVLFEMLSGRVPFGQDSGLEDTYSIQHAHCNEPPPPLREINPNIPPGIEAAIMACLEKDPANRPRTCSELLTELQRAWQVGPRTAPLRQETITERPSGNKVRPIPVTPIPSNPAPVRVNRKMPQGVWYGLGAVTIAAGIGFAVIDHNPKPVSTPQTQTRPSLPNTDTTPHSQTRTTPPRLPSGPTPEQLLAAQRAQQAEREEATRKAEEAKRERALAAQKEEAEREFQEGKTLSNQDEDCKALPHLRNAVALNPANPKYSQEMKTAVTGCNHP